LLTTPLSLSAWAAAFFLSAVLFSHTVALRLVLLGLCGALIATAVVKDRASIRILPPIWVAFTLWAAWAWLSLTWSMEIGYAALAFWVCYVAAQARNAARVIVPIFAAAAVLVCAVALYHFSQGDEPYRWGWHGGPGNLSSALLTLLPCAILAAWYGHRAGQVVVSWSSLALALLLLVAAYTTLNRTIWFGFAAQLLVIGALLAWREGTSIAPRAKVIGAMVAVCVIAGAAFMSSRIQAEREPNGAATALSQDSRFKLWPEVFEYTKARPLTGYGFGRGMLRQSLQNEFNQTLLWHAHNLFLDTVVQVGIPGLLLLVLLLGATLREGWRMAHSPGDLAAACGLAVIGIVAGMVIRNMTDTLWVRQNALLYWGVLGVLLAWGRRPRAPAGS